MMKNSGTEMVDPRETAESSLDAHSLAPHFRSILNARLSRRDALRVGMTATGGLLAASGLAGCTSDSNNSSGDDSGDGGQQVQALSFDSVEGRSGNEVNDVFLPEGYSWKPLIPWGTPILGSFPAFKADGTNTASEQAEQSGEWHDGMHYFPIDDSSTHGVLCVNHESLAMSFFHGYSTDPDTGEAVSNRDADENGLPTNIDQVRKEINSHGVSVVEIQRMGGDWMIVQSGLNRRITAATTMEFSGPAAGSSVLQTRSSPNGLITSGTVNNCGRGVTPWGTYLTCEENFRGYVTTQEDPVPDEKSRYAINAFGFRYRWDAVHDSDEFKRWDSTPEGATQLDDHRNSANHFGWIVEIDPMNPSSTPIKRTGLGRFAHEGCMPGKVEAGKQIAFYSGDDDENEYLYKFVTNDVYDPATASGALLDNGTLYAAKFNEDGTGEWIALNMEDSRLSSRFASQAEIVTFARIAGDLVEATPMDRPEWSTTDPSTGEIYVTLTNNDEKDDEAKERNRWVESSANPRDPNEFGHVLRFAEDLDDPAATTFTWDIFVFGAPAVADANTNPSGLSELNQFAGPDGLYIDDRGVLYIQTDNGGNAVADATNDQILAVIPSNLSDDRTLNGDNQAELKRLLVGPGRCEVTGITLTPDFKTLFVNIQHPGQSFGDVAPSNSFPTSGEASPNNLARSTTIVITRDDDGEIAL